jgi:NAD(P)-dependent dehydrogenase (short-subunit alcohol dehydrogenase family)
MKEIAGKTAFVTGAGSGVGLGIATALVEAGARVALADIRPDHLESATAALRGQGRVHPVRVDVTDRTALEAAAADVEEQLGPVQILCNNAGVNLFTPLAEATYDDVDWVMGVNLGGVINGLLTFLPRIQAHGQGGHIVNTASLASVLPGPPALYTASKFAVRGLSESLRAELEGSGIGVTILCPGLVKTNIHLCHETRPSHLCRHGAPPELTRARLEPLRELGREPLEVGRAAVRAIRDDALYVFTHGEFRPRIEAALEELLRAQPR